MLPLLTDFSQYMVLVGCFSFARPATYRGNLVNQGRNIFVILLALGHAQYILWATDPPANSNCSRQEKKVDIQTFFYFFLRHCKKFGDFFTKSVGFLLKSHRNLSKITQISRRQPASRFLFLFFFLRQKKRTSFGIRRPQNILRMALLNVSLNMKIYDPYL